MTAVTADNDITTVVIVLRTRISVITSDGTLVVTGVTRYGDR